MVDANILDAFMRYVYEHGVKGSGNFVEADMWREVLRIINDATVEGLTQSPVKKLEDSFLHALRHGNEVFSAFKVHTMGKEMQRLLIDESGKLKPFSKWRDDVEKIASHQCGAWLQTEYDTAVIRAHNAADWQEYQQNKDIMPNLRWMPTTSKEPETKHRSYWLRKVNLPVDHPFWNSHHPGDRWNCKCTLEQNDDPIVLPPSGGSDSSATPHQGLENNPGKDGHIYNDTHPYFPKSCNECDAYRASGLKNRLKLLFLNMRKDCYNCPYIVGCIDRTKEIRKLQKERIAEARATIQGKLLTHPDFEHDILVSRDSIKEWVNQPFKYMTEKYQMLLDINKVLRKSEYIGTADNHKNVKKVVQSHIFKTKVLDIDAYIIVRQYESREYILHSISDAQDFMQYVKKK